jgi:hypothetical protein
MCFISLIRNIHERTSQASYGSKPVSSPSHCKRFCGATRDDAAAGGVAPERFRAIEHPWRSVMCFPVDCCRIGAGSRSPFGYVDSGGVRGVRESPAAL